MWETPLARVAFGQHFAFSGSQTGPRGASLTSPCITVEHGHIQVRGAGVTEQAVIQG